MPGLFDFLANDWMPLAVLAKFGWLIQIGLLIHVFRTGRPYWWFWVLLMAPFIGGVAYFFVEILPGLRQPDTAGLLAGLKPRSWRIRELQAALEEADIVKTRLTLATELAAAGRAQEAHTTAEAALTGVFRDDPHTLAAVARRKIEVERWDEALVLLDRVKVKADRMLGDEVALLRGRALLGAGRLAEAEPCFRALEGRIVGEEPRCHLAAVLHATGRPAQAVEIWRDVLKRYRRSTPSWRRTEKRWFKVAKQRLQETAP
jgi:hypothetical protein